MLPKRENALGRSRESSRRSKTLRASRGRAPEGRKSLGAGRGRAPEGRKSSGEVVGMLPKVENASGRSRERSHSLKTVLCRCQSLLAQAVIGIVGMTVREDAVRASPTRSCVPTAARGSRIKTAPVTGGCSAVRVLLWMRFA